MFAIFLARDQQRFGWAALFRELTSKSALLQLFVYTI